MKRFSTIEFSQSIRGLRKTVTPCETGQNLLLTAPILNSATAISNGDIIMETPSVAKVSMAFIIFVLVSLLFKQHGMPSKND